MKTDIYIGIDMGSTGLKVVAFDACNGAALAVAGDSMPHQRFSGGGCELPAQCISDALMQALSRVTEQLGARTRQVRGIACTGHGAGLYALDKHGALLRNLAVASTDHRAHQRAAVLAEQYGEALYEEVGCQPWAGQPLLVAAELVARGELDADKIRHIVFAKDYLTWLLTAELATLYCTSS